MSSLSLSLPASRRQFIAGPWQVTKAGRHGEYFQVSRVWCSGFYQVAKGSQRRTYQEALNQLKALAAGTQDSLF